MTEPVPSQPLKKAGKAGLNRARMPIDLSAARQNFLKKTIVETRNVPSRALSVVIAIMTFLACMTIGGIELIRQASDGWENEISREITLQIAPSPGVDMELAIKKASKIVKNYAGVKAVRQINKAGIRALLAPWLGDQLELEQLPIPKLLVIQTEDGQDIDIESMREELSQSIKGVYLDDHQQWVDRLAAMSGTLVSLGIAVFLLVMAATVLSIVFATQGAMASNQEVIEVLYFVGAEANYVGRQFQIHFFRLGLIGAGLGVLAAIVLFLAVSFFAGYYDDGASAAQIRALFGKFELDWFAFIFMAIVGIMVSLLTAITSYITVRTQFWKLEEKRLKPPQ